MSAATLHDLREQGLCAQPGVPAEVFFPKSRADTARADQITAALAYCNACPVTAACLEYALPKPDLHGVWGATTAKERQRLRRCHTGRCNHPEHRQEIPLMDGPSHYRAAERLLAGEPHPDGGVVMLDAERIAKAQVHATLALAAATAELDAYTLLDGPATGRTSDQMVAWRAVFGGTTPDGAA